MFPSNFHFLKSALDQYPEEQYTEQFYHDAHLATFTGILCYRLRPDASFSAAPEACVAFTCSTFMDGNSTPLRHSNRFFIFFLPDMFG